MASKTVTRPIKATFGELIFMYTLTICLFCTRCLKERQKSESIVWGSNQLCQRFSFSFMMCSLVRVVFVHLIFIQYWKLKIKTSQSWFSMFDPQKLKIKNLQSQFSIFVAKKGKIKHHSSIFWKSKTKNWKWPVSGFNFLFSISSSQDSSY